MCTCGYNIVTTVYKNYYNNNASESLQKLIGRIFVVIVAIAALVVAIISTEALRQNNLLKL